MDVYEDIELDDPSWLQGVEDCSFYGIVPKPGMHVGAGEELVQAYTRKDNADRLFRCGFLLEGNPVPVEPLPMELCRLMLQAAPSPPPLLPSRSSAAPLGRSSA